MICIFAVATAMLNKLDVSGAERITANQDCVPSSPALQGDTVFPDDNDVLSRVFLAKLPEAPHLLMRRVAGIRAEDRSPSA